MNKIYKVIWSKTRNCYVAVAEFVKRNGKGGSVLNRRHIAAALAAVAICAAPAGALAANTGGHWDGSNYIGDAPNYKVVIDSDTNGHVYGRLESDKTATGASVTVESGTVGNEWSWNNVYGGRSYLFGNAEKNTVTISGGTVGSVYGGRSEDGSATNNTVTITGGEVQGYVYGGYSDYGNAEKNTVTITGGTVNWSMYGGYSRYGDAVNNTVILSRQGSEAPPDINGTLFGGLSLNSGTVSNNTLQVEAVGLSAPQIARFDNYKFVLPSDIKAGDTMLTLTNQDAGLTIDGTKVDMAVAKDGGLNIGFGESVTLLHKTGGGGAFSVTNLTGEVQTSKLDGESTGFDVMKYKLDKPDHEDKLNVTVSELHLYGDGGTNTPGQRQTGNTLIINSGKADVAFGGRASSGTVTGNNVKMTGGELVPRRIDIKIGDYYVNTDLFGGFADDGNAEKNAVEVSGGKVGHENSYGGRVYGGFSYSGDATGNTVTISGGWVRFAVYGGTSYSGSGAATGNTVTISGGTVNYVHGGYSVNGDATNNTVTISGGTVNNYVYGGRSDYGDATNNTVILSRQGSVAPPDINGTLYGGSGGTVSDNTLQVEAVDLSAPQIRNFDTYRFVLPSDIKAGDTMLQLTNQNDDDVTIDSSRVSFATDSGFGLNLGESITLLEKIGGTTTLNLTGDRSSYERLDGEAGGLPVKLFKLNVSQEKDKVDAKYAARFLYGEGGTNTPGQRETGNTLTIADGEKASVAFGGRAVSGAVTGNKVKMTGGEIVSGDAILIDGGGVRIIDVSGDLFGGFADAGDVEANTVAISGGKVNGDVYGGYSSKRNATGNKVILSKQEGGTAPDINGTLFGGFSYNGGTVSNNTLQVEAVGLSAPEIQNFENYRFVLPKDIKAGDTMLTLNNQSSKLEIDGSKVDVSMGGGTIADIGLTLDESVTLLHKTGGSGAFSVNNSNKTVYTKTLDDAAGGLPEDIYSLTASEDKLNVTYTERYLYGDGGTNTTGQRETGNTLFIADGEKASVAFGGRASNRDVTGNKVIMSGGEIVGGGVIQIGSVYVSGNLYGGFADTGNAVKNAVELSGGTVAYDVYGGYSYSGNAENNTVTITGGTADDDVYGGYSEQGNVEKNTVTITGGTADDEVYGGYSEQGNVEKNTVTITGGTVEEDVVGGYSYSGNAENNTVTISGGTVEGKVYGGYSYYGNAENNTVTISGGTVEYDVVGGDSYYGNENNTVTISGGTVEGKVYGGYSYYGNAENNTVTISGGTVEGKVYGGYSDTRNGNATGNKVILSKQEGGTAPVISGTLFGGFSYDGGTVSNNTLQVEAAGLSAPEIQNFDNYRFVLPKDIKANDIMLTLKNQGSKLEIDGSRVDMAVAKGSGLNVDFGERITLLHKAGGEGAFSVKNLTGAVQTSKLDGVSTGFDVMKYTLDKPANEDKLNVTVSELWLYGDGGTNTKGRREKDNTLTINSGKANAAFGGRATSGDVTGNKVEMTGGELVRLSDSSDPDYGISGNLYGGYTDAGNVQGNTVEMSGGRQEIGLYGGYTKSGMAGGDKPEHGNKVSMTGGEANNITGGSTDDGAAGYNTVSVSNAKVAHATGGATLEGDAVGNTVTLSNTDVDFTVTGGDVYRGRAAENTVTIDGGSVGMNVFGGVSISGNVENNTVSILGGKINGVFDGLKTGLTGGYGSERVVGNTVAITGGELFVESVYGGYHTSRSGSGLAEKNVVTLGGGSYDAGLNVIGGGSNNEANDNAVNLTGTTQGLDGAKLYGWKETEDGATVTGTGNELHVGGTKTYDKNGAATIAKGSWQGMDANGKHTNRVDTVANFDSIALHNVVWGDVPALSAKNMVNIGGLDVTGLEFFTHPNDSTVHEHALKDSMVLVHSDGKALTGLNISYLDEGTVKTEALTNQGIDYHTAAHSSEEGGVTVDGIEKKRIYLADHNQSVDFLYHVDGEKITLGDVKFVKDGTAQDGTARILDGRFDVRNADIDAAGFKMTADSMKTVNAGDTMTVVDAEDAIKAKGTTATLKTFTGEGVTGGVKKYDVAFSDDVTANLNLSGIHTDTLSQNAEQTKLTYTVGEKKVSEATMTGELAWSDGGILYTNTSYNFNTDAKTDLGGLTFATVTADPTGQSMTLIGGKAAGTVENAPASFGVTLAKANTTLDATAAGVATVANGDVTYSVTGVTLDKVTVNQVTATADTVPDGWTVAKDASGKTALTIDTENMTLPTGSANKEHAILTISNDSFAGATVTGQYAYASHSSFTKANGGVSIAGEKEGGVKLSGDSKSVVYHVVQDHVKDVTLGSVTFAKDTTLLPVGNEYEFTKVNAVNAQNFAMNYAAPQNVAVRDSMTLLQANNTLQANALLANMAADVKSQTQPYSFAPVDGVTVAARITGSLGTTAKGDGFTYTVNSNQADSLTFGSVDWKDGGILLTRPANIIFAGAAVDTSRIHFKNVHELDANKQMTLVSDFGNKAGTITGSKYYIGTTLEGEGRATLNGNDLVFTTHSSTNPNPGPTPEPTPDPTPLHAQEQTHNTVMGQTAGISLLSSGAEQISQALNSLSLLDSFGGMTGTGGTGSTTGTSTTAQTGGEGGSSGQSGSGGSEPSGQGQEGSGGSETGNEKGQSKESDDRNGSGNSDQQESNAEANGIIIASVGGGHMHQETGSHVTSNSWNGVLGIGGKRAGKNGTLQYLAFAEHGRANFTLHGDAGRGDGTSKYVGGGLIGKWQNRRDVYVEASIRAGRMHDTANHMLYDDATGQSYGYDVHANYIGGHIGIGKVFTYNNGRTLDVYGKYFHMKRDGVSFEAGGHFDLDSVTSSVLRVGARYGATDKKWNWYGGLAYEYEFDGKSTGRADGAPIRAASMEGGSVRAEIGLRMEASKTSPWKADINLSGYAGKRRGISGNVAVAYTF